MQKNSSALFFFCLFTAVLSAQNKKPLDHDDVGRWRKIEQTKVANDGQWVAYVQTPVTEGDPALYLWNAKTKQNRVFLRGTEPKFSADNRLLVFRIRPQLDTLKAQRRRKVKEEDLPKDTLALYTLATGELEKMARLKNFTVPDKWSGWLAYQVESAKPAPSKKDTAAAAHADSLKNKVAPKVEERKAGAKKSAKKPKKEDKDNGYQLIVRSTTDRWQDTFAYVVSYVLAKEQPRLLLHTSGKGDTLAFSANPQCFQPGVYWLDLGRQTTLRPLLRAKGKYSQLSLHDQGGQAAFVADTDTSKARIRPWNLYYWAEKQDSARSIPWNVNVSATAATLPAISENTRPVFSEDGNKLYFGVAPPPVLNDTSLLPEEIVNVEVWAWTENRLYTEQKNRLEGEKKRAYSVVWHIKKDKLVPLGSKDIPEVRYQEQRDADLALGFNDEIYAKSTSWEGAPHRDLYAIDVKTGDKQRIADHLRCSNLRLSPDAKYIVWWSDPDTAWYAWNARNRETKRLTNANIGVFYDEETDVPDYPPAHGAAAWLGEDDAMLVSDPFDLWRIDPSGKQAPRRLTKGRETKTTYRYLRLDPEERSIAPDARLLLHQFNEVTKAEGYAWLDLKTAQPMPWVNGEYVYTRQPVKAKNAPAIVYSRENFLTFPDLLLTGEGTSTDRISNANPQQNEYRWGSMEQVRWTSLSGETLSGLLVKPDNFDPAKQYPMIVNFYEKLSDDLYKHRAPEFHRSQINYTFYASRGYLVFAPDIPYRTGYPGASAYDAIVSGVTTLIDKGFVDPKRVALQGHSWGGYQAAYLVTRTNLFRCAEAGAPVANMTSAYGGIRWESGVSRAFQYERQQSRIGGTLWEYPMRYLENSPLFALDKVQTPLLILHNDKDGAVPWYQGIELYSGLRRLGKPAWMLNYNDEPHWPVKLQNRVDFQRRMQQFFDHYLLDAPLPRWMKRGVPPAEKGILQGFEVGDD